MQHKNEKRKEKGTQQKKTTTTKRARLILQFVNLNHPCHNNS